MLSGVTAKNVGNVFFETHCRLLVPRPYSTFSCSPLFMRTQCSLYIGKMGTSTIHIRRCSIEYNSPPNPSRATVVIPVQLSLLQARMCSLNGLLAFDDENYRWLLCNRTYLSCHTGMLSNF